MRHDIEALEKLERRVAELRAWARSRIAWCEGPEWGSWSLEIIAARTTEAHTLRAVLRIIDGEGGG
jgi:hypothetical protein